jgi:hypothetical protein
MKINSTTSELSFYISEISVQRKDFFVDLIDSKDLYSCLLDGDEFAVVIVEEDDLINNVFVWGTI